MWSKGQGKWKKKVRVWKAPREKHVLNCLLLFHKWKKQKPSQNCEENYLCSSQTYYWWAMFLLSANVPTLTLSPFIPRHLATGGAPSRQQVWNSCFAKTSLVSLLGTFVTFHLWVCPRQGLARKKAPSPPEDGAQDGCMAHGISWASAAALEPACWNLKGMKGMSMLTGNPWMLTTNDRKTKKKKKRKNINEHGVHKSARTSVNY